MNIKILTGQDLLNYRIFYNLKQETLSEKSGVPRSTIARYESSKDFIKKAETIKKLEMAFENVEIANPTVLIREPESAPYYENMSASAGLSYLTDNANQPETYIKIPGAGVDAYINVFGDSMYPKYCSGEIIGIKLIEKDNVFPGHAYVVEMIDGEAYVKYIKNGKDTEHWILESENPAYESKQFHISKIKKVYIIKSVITRTSL